MVDQSVRELIDRTSGGVRVDGDRILVEDENRVRTDIEKLARISALGVAKESRASSYLIRSVAQEMGIIPASIQDLYLARGRGEIPPIFTVPAINLRVLTFDAARAAFRAAIRLNTSAVLFEISRAELAFTRQSVEEYSAAVLAAAVSVGYRGPIFLQGDHFQISRKEYERDPRAEMESLKRLMQRAVGAGFFNIDIDASTLVDPDRPTIPDQQHLNVQLTAELYDYMRSIEPEGVSITIGGEIGEVGSRNSTPEELRIFLEGVQRNSTGYAAGKPGISKISIQTGTTHGGEILPDGSQADIEIDFETMRSLSRLARIEYGLGGAVQHGASTLPAGAFPKFVEAETLEIHLASHFMNLFFDQIPEDLRTEMYRYLHNNLGGEKQPGMTDAQFIRKNRKYILGVFKGRIDQLPGDIREQLGELWENSFFELFKVLGLEGTRSWVESSIQSRPVPPLWMDYQKLGEGFSTHPDLAD